MTHGIRGSILKYPETTLNELFSKQVDASSDSVALEFDANGFTYKELNKKVNQIANYFLAYGLQPGQFVAVSMERTPDLIASLLAITQCGAAYLPLDPKFPKARLEYMLQDSEASFLLTTREVSETIPQFKNTVLIEDVVSSINKYSDTKVPVVVSNHDVAYILYTSGSTGKPKGVTITHGNLVNFLSSMAIEPGINQKDRLLSITTISFDIAGLELFLPLVNGATLIFADYDTVRDGQKLLRLIQDKKISILQATPTTWQMLLDSGWASPLDLKALCGGEAMPLNLAQALTSKCSSLWNMYGPTETTIWSVVKKIQSDDETITIGHPIANTQIYLLDENGKAVEKGQIGEIVIGGDGVAKGYWKRPELSAEKFIENPFTNAPNSILYRTGDLGKLLPNGELQCLGRVDQQIKIRGHRIEPGEIEQALMSIDGIKQAVVLAHDNFLIAHIVAASNIKDIELYIPSWRETLLEQLPAHLIPHEFNLLDELPTTPNGKVDRKALSEYKSGAKQEFTGPRTEEEKIVADIWKESLKLDKIDVHSNFFELGGYSIIAVKVMSKLEHKTGKKFPISTLFEHPTIEKIAKLFNTGNGKYSGCLVPLKANGNKIPLFIVHGAGLNVLNFINLSKHFDEDQPVYGIQGTGPNGYEDWYKSIEDMAAHYVDAIIKLYPNGPYALAGFSFGGIVAFEMASQLKARDKEVIMTAMLDTYAEPSYFYKTLSQKKLIRKINISRKRLRYTFQMLTSWKLFKLRARDKKKYLLNKYFGVKEVISDQEAIAHEQFVEADRMVHGIIDRYQLIPRQIHVDLFRSTDDTDYKSDTMYLGWNKAALDGVNLHKISGNHLSIVEPPNDKLLAQSLQDILNKRQVVTERAIAE